MSKKALIILFSLSFVLLSFAALDFVAAAQDANVAAVDDAGVGVVDQAKGVLSSFKSGKIVLGLGFVMMLIGSIGRSLASMKWDFWKSKAGGYTTAALAGLSALGLSIVTAGAFSLDGLWAAILITTSAMGLSGPAKAAVKKLKG